ncbi:SEL1-like repeat protein [Roseomonas populi]|uniref:Sel1 repeat family protein n=1 Tax=Roseomonas populi TaxID=3121582 RepID=A0ABT1X8H3_9PROT|nr:hypothetical protein [Roseomonas pecuniae]MCR0984410.1 hypothetical protein [Roseomonas pecuniae]
MTSDTLHDAALHDPLLEAWSGDVLPYARLRGEDGSPQGVLHCALLHRDYGVALLDLAPDEKLDAAERFSRLHRYLYPDQPVPPVVYRSLSPMDLWRLTIILDSAFALEPPLKESGPDWMERARELLAGEPEPQAEAEQPELPPLAMPARIEVPVPESDPPDARSEAGAGETVVPAIPRRRLSALLLLPALAAVTLLAALPWLRAPRPDAGVTAVGTAPPRAEPVQSLAMKEPTPGQDEVQNGEVPPEEPPAVPAAMRPAGRAPGETDGMGDGPAPEKVGPRLTALPALAVPPPPPLPPLEPVLSAPAGPMAELLAPSLEMAAAPAAPEAERPTLPPVPDAAPAWPASPPNVEAQPPVLGSLRLPTIPVLAPAPRPEPDTPPLPQALSLVVVPPQPVGAAAPAEIVLAAPPPAPAAPPLPDEAIRAETPGEEIRPEARAEPAAPPAGSDPALLQLLLRRGDALLALGDVSAARLFYERAAMAGSSPAAVAMARTYDPAILAELGVRGLRPERDAAIAWYRRAVALGGKEAIGPLERLETQGMVR